MEKIFQRLQKINSIRFSLQRPLEKFRTAVSGKKTVTELLLAVYGLLDDFDVKQNLVSCAKSFLEADEILLYNEYTRVYGVFIDMLDSIYEMSGRRIMSPLTIFRPPTMPPRSRNKSWMPSWPRLYLLWSWRARQ